MKITKFNPISVLLTGSLALLLSFTMAYYQGAIVSRLGFDPDGDKGFGGGVLELDSGESIPIYYFIGGNIILLQVTIHLDVESQIALTTDGKTECINHIKMDEYEITEIPEMLTRFLTSNLQALDYSLVAEIGVYLKGWPFKCFSGYFVQYTDGTKLQHNLRTDEWGPSWPFSSRIMDFANPVGVHVFPMLLNIVFWFMIFTPLLLSIHHFGRPLWRRACLLYVLRIKFHVHERGCCPLCGYPMARGRKDKYCPECGWGRTE